MCFTPIISLSTAIIEFVLATILLIVYPKTKLRNFFALFIYWLGFYQFSEFMLCSSVNPAFWAILGVITYSFLPALGLHAVLRIFNRKLGLLWVYIIPVITSIVAISIPGFVIISKCEKFFVNVVTIMTVRESLVYTIPYYIFLLYYVGFIFISCRLIYNDYVKQKNPIKRDIEFVEILGVIFMTVPTFILVIVLPPLGYRFPSILCEFAIFVAITAFIGASLEGKLYRRKKKK